MSFAGGVQKRRGLVEHLLDRYDWEEHPHHIFWQRLESVILIKLHPFLCSLGITAIEDIEHHDCPTYVVRDMHYSRQAVHEEVTAVSAVSEFRIATDHRDAGRGN